MNSLSSTLLSEPGISAANAFGFALSLPTLIQQAFWRGFGIALQHALLKVLRKHIQNIIFRLKTFCEATNQPEIQLSGANGWMLPFQILEEAIVPTKPGAFRMVFQRLWGFNFCKHAARDNCERHS